MFSLCNTWLITPKHGVVGPSIYRFIVQLPSGVLFSMALFLYLVKSLGHQTVSGSPQIMTLVAALVILPATPTEAFLNYSL